MGNFDRYMGDPRQSTTEPHRAGTPYAGVFFRGVLIGSLLGGVLGPVSILISAPTPDWEPTYGVYLLAGIFGLFIGGLVAGFAAALALGLHVLAGRLSERLRAPGAAVGGMLGSAIPVFALLSPDTHLTVIDIRTVLAMTLTAAFLAVILTKRLRTWPAVPAERPDKPYF